MDVKDLYSIETPFGEIKILELPIEEIELIEEFAVDALNQKETDCKIKAVLCGFIKWMDLLAFANEKRNPETDCIQ